jgi:futalosine hydrolase
LSAGPVLVVCALLPELRYATLPAEVEVLACGVGPVEAAIAVASALARNAYRAVVNAGIAGAFRGSARIGDALLVDEEILADFGLEGGGSLSLPGGATLAGRAVADAGLLRRAGGLALRRVRGLTVAQITATDATATRLRVRYDTDVESMEGFSVLRAAALANTPALEVRGISNYVGDRASSEWDFAAGARATAGALEAVLSALVQELS